MTVPLLGTDELPHDVVLIPGQTIPLVRLVHQAFMDSGLEASEWNELPQAGRDARIFGALALLRLEAENAPAEPVLWRWRLNPCDIARLRVLVPIGDALAGLWHSFTVGTECPCCLGTRLLVALTGAAGVGAGLHYLLG